MAGRSDLSTCHHPTYSQGSAYHKALAPDLEEAHPARARDTRDESLRLYESGKRRDIPLIKGATWAASHAVAVYVDRLRPTRGVDDFNSTAGRPDSAWIGRGARLKKRAFDLAMETAAGE